MSAETSTSSTSMQPPAMASSNGFLPASSLPRPVPSAPVNGSASSLRNAENGQESIPDSNTSTTNASASSSSTASTSSAPMKPVNRPAQSKNAIIYNAVQRRNPVTHSIKNVSTEVGEIAADFQVGLHAGVLFLSLKYHRLHPEYIHGRIEKMKNMYTLRILLILCDVSEHQQTIRELSKIAIINELTTFVAWSNDEVAQYLATFKSFEHKSADSLKERVHQTYPDQLQHVLTSGKKVNKTDADNLASQFGSFANISKQSSKVLSSVKGLGATKVTSLVDAFTKPFLVGRIKRSSADNGNTTMERTEIVTPALQRSGKGKEETTQLHEGVQRGRAQSPDWEDAEEEGIREFSPTRARAPSRSPGLSPEPRMLDSADAAWRDPLEDEDDGDEDGQPNSKRIRTE